MALNIEKESIGAIVALDYRTAAVFQKFGLDFCCNGSKTIDEACENTDHNIKQIKKEVRLMLNRKKDSASTEYHLWPLDLLAHYIEKKHHRYVSDKIPEIQVYLNKLCKVHGSNHPELFEIFNLFSETAADLTMHMKKEELMLFPFITKMVQAENDKQPIKAPHFGTVKNPIQMMMSEHQDEGDRFHKIAELSDGYTPPSDACNTYRVTLNSLKEFEEDLHKHIHLENNILFPKSIVLEKKLSGEPA